MELLAGLIQKTQIVLKKKAFELLSKVLRETDKLDENKVCFLLILTGYYLFVKSTYRFIQTLIT